jgi:hypothetical protein
MKHAPTNPDELAFPGTGLVAEGITKREYFALKIMQGIIQRPGANYTDSADISVRAADFLIKMLNKPPESR